tara:strand:+ start:135 stop:290 length:156 start_codon:yes stop_codon:yes gene_type:complete
MADILTATYGKDTGSGNKLNTGSMRRSYGTKRKSKNLNKIRVCNNKYKEGV